MGCDKGAPQPASAPSARPTNQASLIRAPLLPGLGAASADSTQVAPAWTAVELSDSAGLQLQPEPCHDYQSLSQNGSDKGSDNESSGDDDGSDEELSVHVESVDRAADAHANAEPGLGQAVWGGRLGRLLALPKPLAILYFMLTFSQELPVTAMGIILVKSLKLQPAEVTTLLTCPWSFLRLTLYLCRRRLPSTTQYPSSRGR